jgi:dynein heavy chain
VCGAVQLCRSLLNILDCFFEPYMEKEARDPPTAEVLSNLNQCLAPLFVFALVWSAAATTNRVGRRRMDAFIRSELAHMSFAKPFPDVGLVYDYKFDVVRAAQSQSRLYTAPYDVCVSYAFVCAWVWVRACVCAGHCVLDSVDADRRRVRDEQQAVVRGADHPHQGLGAVQVPRSHAADERQVRADGGPHRCVGCWRVCLHAVSSRCVTAVDVGALCVGTGKTANLTELLASEMPAEYIPIFLTFSAQTSANQTQDIIDSKMEKRRRGVFGPAAGTKYILFVDDLNMPQREKYFAQPPIELLRQWCNHGGWYVSSLLPPPRAWPRSCCVSSTHACCC